MEDFLFSKKLHLPLGSKPEEMKIEEWNLLDRQVLGVIRLTLSKNVTHNMEKEKTIVGMMKALVEMYKKPSVNNKMYLMKKLPNFKMLESGPVVEHLNSFNIMVNQLVLVRIKFDDEICTLILLASLSNS